jgi:hexosaminidase
MLARNIAMLICTLGTQASFTTAAGTGAERPALVPQPAELRTLQGVFPLSGEIQVYTDAADNAGRAVAEVLVECLKSQTGLPATLVSSEQALGAQFLLMVIPPDATLGAAGYELVVSPMKVMLRAAQPQGMFLGVQTIRQLVTPDAANPYAWQLPCVRIKDWPRYRWRGMLLDCGRHFMSKEFVKRYIDLLAYHKMNVLHWHLTEDQGWRIEIKKYPRLTEIGAWRGAGDERYGGFYTQQDVKEIVAYAKSRYITVVPEIEMPGHSTAALAAYPELSCTGGPFEVSTRWGVHSEVYCAGNDQVFEFLQDVLSEVIELFPSEFIHIGGDECPKERWNECTKCQDRIKAEGLKDEHELQSYFIRRIEKFLSSKGRRLIGWDEILEGGLAPNATVQSWRGMKGAIAAATAGHDVISSPTSHCYLDYAQRRAPGEPTWMGFIDLETCYSFEPTPAELTPDQARHVLGLEGNMWTEHAPPQRVDWQVFPRLCALAEVGWSPREQRDWGDFQRRMKAHYARLDALGVTYFLPPPECTTKDTAFTDALEVTLDNPLGRGEVRYTLDGSEPTHASPKYTQPLKLTDSTRLRARTFIDGGRSSDVAEYHFRKLRPIDPVPVPDAAPGLACAYYEGRFGQLPEFDQLEPVATSVVETFGLDARKRDDRFALTFTGYVEVPAEGTYTFHLKSDDGSRLLIGPEVVVDNDGLHAATEKRGPVILKAGRHPIRVEYFQAGGARALEVSYEGPGVAKQPIPASALYRG